MPTDTNKWKKGEFAIKDLSLWDENPRFPQEYFNKSEDGLIEYFLAKKELKILDFATEVVNDFDLPQLEKIVVLELDGKKIVLEGNRRLTAYKLLANPALARKRQDVKKHFEELKKRITISSGFTLEANITTDKDEGLRYVDRKHNRSNNEVGWGEPERRHFAVRRSSGGARDIVRVALANAVKELSLPEALKEAVLGKGFVTTFYRIADSAAARTKLGYELKEDGTLQSKNQKTFEDLLKVVSYNVWSKKDFRGNAVDSRSLNRTEAIDDYVKHLKQSDASRVDKEIKKQVKSDVHGGNTAVAGTPGRSRQLSGVREHLVLSSLYIQDHRINDIYDELKKKLKVDYVPNAVAVLFRVFLECSVDYYIEKNNISIKSDTHLDGKILKVVDHLEDALAQKHLKGQGIKNPSAADTKKAKEKMKLKSARKVATKDNNSILSVTTFHDFVHDYKTSPVPSELKTHWENLDSFFVALWGSFISAKKK